jgi:hypothetical protein
LLLLDQTIDVCRVYGSAPAKLGSKRKTIGRVSAQDDNLVLAVWANKQQMVRVPRACNAGSDNAWMDL